MVREGPGVVADGLGEGVREAPADVVGVGDGDGDAVVVEGLGSADADGEGEGGGADERGATGGAGAAAEAGACVVASGMRSLTSWAARSRAGAW
ncbi:hypothetical protein [Streptomyces musisoli]|uniref:hypothetical protein n=1 Tax=Streptomyces musisoli TaxID=2802280 RepID=UPI001F447A4C|nr:hypothetical protein [Streptomyces musisoli]